MIKKLPVLLELDHKMLIKIPLNEKFDLISHYSSYMINVSNQWYLTDWFLVIDASWDYPERISHTWHLYSFTQKYSDALVPFLPISSPRCTLRLP